MCSWGSNSQGQVSDSEPSLTAVSPTRVSLPSPAVQIALGVEHTCALVTDGIWCWGDGSHGQLAGGDAWGPVVSVGP